MPPSVGLSTPDDGAVVSDAEPRLGGPAGTAGGDGETVTVSLHGGRGTGGPLVGTLEAPVDRAAAAWSRTPAAPLADGLYTVQARQSDAAGNTADTAAHSFTVDTTAPALALDPVPGDGTLTEPRPTFGGTAGTADGDASTVTLRLFAAAAPSGAAVRTASAAVDGDGGWTTTLADALPEGDYVARAEQSDAAGNTTVTSDRAFTLGPAHLLAAGDIASCFLDGDTQTAALLAGRPGTVAALGDEVYGGGDDMPDGSLAAFNQCYEPNWGQEKARTKPVPGNHEYWDPGAAGYFSYFGASAGDPSKGYYSYDLGAWHVVALNSNCEIVSCSAGDAQEAWLRADLAAHPSACTLAYWHHPLFTSDAEYPSDGYTAPLWRALEAGGADVVLTGHAHNYERFAPQTADAVQSATGIRQFVVGTGGKSHFDLKSPRSVNSEAADSTSFGILDLALHQGSYDWEFIPVPGSTFTDTGTTACH